MRRKHGFLSIKSKGRRAGSNKGPRPLEEEQQSMRSGQMETQIEKSVASFATFGVRNKTEERMAIKGTQQRIDSEQFAKRWSHPFFFVLSLSPLNVRAKGKETHKDKHLEQLGKVGW